MIGWGRQAQHGPPTRLEAELFAAGAALVAAEEELGAAQEAYEARLDDVRGDEVARRAWRGEAAS